MAFEGTPSIEAVSEKLLLDLNNSDLTGKVLRGHLWLEYSIEEGLRRTVASYEHFEKTRLSFSAKIHLARSMNISEEDEYRVVLFLNRIRNNIAHQFSYVLTPEIERQLLNLSSPRLIRTGIIKESREFPEGIQRIFTTLVVGLHLKVDHIEAHQRFDRWQKEKTMSVIQEMERRSEDKRRHL